MVSYAFLLIFLWYRTSKASQKLKVLPEHPELTNKVDVDQPDDDDDDFDDDDFDDDAPSRPEVYRQISKIPAGAPRKDARLLTKKEKENLPRVTAYCTASSYRLTELHRHLDARQYTHATNPKLFDDVIYTSYLPSSATNTNEVDLLGVPELIDRKNSTNSRYDRFQLGAHTPDVFFFCDTGVVIMWGMEEVMEKRVLNMLKRFEVEKLATEDVEMEDLNFYYA